MLGGDNHPAVPMDQIIAKELELVGSHGMQSHAYDRMLSMIAKGLLEPEKLIGSKITLEGATEALMNMDSMTSVGITVIDRM